MACIKGSYWKIDFARRQNGRKPAKEFIESLDEKAQIRFRVLFETVTNRHIFTNTQKFKKLKGRGQIWQFTSGDYRILAYCSGNTFFLTNGFRKEQNVTERRYIKSAVNIKNEHLTVLGG